MFSSRSFIVSGLMFRSLIHFEFIFVHGVKNYSSFILLQVVDQFSQHHLLKRLSFLHCIFLPPLSKKDVHRCVGLSLGFLFCSIDLYFCLCARIERHTCTPMFITALFRIARTWKQPRCPAADEWIRKLCTYTRWSITQPLKRIYLNQF